MSKVPTNRRHIAIDDVVAGGIDRRKIATVMARRRIRPSPSATFNLSADSTVTFGDVQSIGGFDRHLR
jgi:hypothetical protein